MNKNDVINNFLEEKSSKASALSSDGSTLYSYAMPIARHTDEGVVVRDMRGLVSATTSRHVTLIIHHVGKNNIISDDEWKKRFMKTKIEIIKETKDYYVEDVSRRAVDLSNGCEYITRDGRMCAVGRCCEDPEPWNRLFDALDDLKPEYQGHDQEFWVELQHFHDYDKHWNEHGLTGRGQYYYKYLMTKYENEN